MSGLIFRFIHFCNLVNRIITMCLCFASVVPRPCHLSPGLPRLQCSVGRRAEAAVQGGDGGGEGAQLPGEPLSPGHCRGATARRDDLNALPADSLDRYSRYLHAAL